VTRRPRLPLALAGFRRVHLVRIVVDDDGRWAEVIGAQHRFARARRIPIATALALARRGAAFEVVDRRSGELSGTLVSE
jgi:hypothetical protein